MTENTTRAATLFEMYRPIRTGEKLFTNSGRFVDVIDTGSTDQWIYLVKVNDTETGQVLIFRSHHLFRSGGTAASPTVAELHAAGIFDNFRAKKTADGRD